MKKQKSKIHFNLFDYFWFAVGITTSVAAFFVDHEHSLGYILLGSTALICAIITEILSAKGRRINFLFSIINAIAYGAVAWMNHFYGNAITSVLFYAPIGLFGFYSWGKNSNKNKEVIVRKLSITQIFILVLAIVVLSVCFNKILEMSGGESTILDGISTVMVPIASILGVLRYRETWLIWFVSDLIVLSMWTSTSDITIMVLRIFYPISSIYGFASWKRLLAKNKKK